MKKVKKRLRRPRISCKQDSFKIRLELLTGTVPVNKKLLTGTVPVNKKLLTGTLTPLTRPKEKSLVLLYYRKRNPVPC